MSTVQIELPGQNVGQDLYSVRMKVLRSVPVFHTYAKEEVEGFLALLEHPMGVYKLKVINIPGTVGALGGYALTQPGDMLHINYLINQPDDRQDRSNYFINMENRRTVGKVLALRNLTLENIVSGHSR